MYEKFRMVAICACLLLPCVARAGDPRNSGVAIIEAGVAIDLGQRWSLVPAYRYMRFVGDPDRYGEEAAHVVKLGLRRAF